MVVELGQARSIQLKHLRLPKVAVETVQNSAILT